VPPGTYTASVTDASGCASQLTKTINPAPPFSFSISSTFLSGNQQLVLVPSISGGTGAWTYLWNTGSANDSLFVQQNGTYRLQLTDTVNGCIFLDSITVTQFTSVSSTASESLFSAQLESENQQILVSGLLPGEKIEISDLNGRIMPLPQSRLSERQIRMKVNSLSKGRYLIRSSGSQRRLIRKILIL